MEKEILNKFIDHFSLFSMQIFFKMTKLSVFMILLDMIYLQSSEDGIQINTIYSSLYFVVIFFI